VSKEQERMVRLPADEGELRSMLAQGLLDEGHSVELKRQLPLGKAENKELAKDLAQFTIDGGVLIIGVDEGDETTPPSLTRSTSPTFRSASRVSRPTGSTRRCMSASRLSPRPASAAKAF
jgi:hypothetical protein